MKNPTPNTIANPVTKIETTKPSWIEEFVIETRDVTHEGQTYSYLVVNEEEFGKKFKIPKTFASYSEQGLISISSNYPEQYKELGITHEIREHNEHKGENGCCLACLKTELEDLEKTELDKKEYIQFRLGFFEHLVNYYSEKTRAGNEDAILANLTQSRNYLIDILGQLQ